MTDVAMRFGAQDVGLSAQFTKVGRELTRLDRTVDSVGRSSAASFTRIGAVATIAAAAVTKVAVELVQYADGLDKAAAQTGVTIEALQRLRFVADQVGVGADTITRAIGKLQISLVSADEGSREAAKGLAALGLSAGSLINLAPDEAFNRIATAVAAIENPTERTAAAVAVFGKAGAELVPILSQSAVEMAAVNAQFEALGGPVSTATIKDVDNMGDAFDGLKLTLKNLGTEILGLVSGPFTKLFQTVGESVGALRTALFGNELEQIKEGIKFLENVRNSGVPGALNIGKSGFNPEGGVEYLNAGEIDQRLKELRARQRELQAAMDLQRGFAPMLQDFSMAPPQTSSGTSVADGRDSRGGITDTRGGGMIDTGTQGYIGIAAAQFEEYSLLQERFRQANLQSLQSYSDEMLRINLAAEEQRIADTIDAEQRIYDLKAGAINAAGDLLSLLAAKSKTAAIALIAINKGLAIARIVQDTAAAAAKAIAIYGPTPQGFAAAGAAKAFGAAQIALVAATGALEIGSLGGGGGGGGGGSGGAASLGGAAGGERPEARGASPQTAVQVYINGVVTQKVLDELWKGFEEKFDRGAVLFNGQSRQAFDIRE